MAGYRKKTLRQMSPTTRQLARLIGEAESAVRRLKKLVPEIQRLEADSQALVRANELPAKAKAQTLNDARTKLDDARAEILAEVQDRLTD